MAYPSPPDFTSPAPFSAWFAVAQGANVRLCATQGRSFVQRLQRRLNAALAGLRGHGQGAATVQPEIPRDGAWSRATADALANYARLLDDEEPGQGWGEIAAQLASAAVAGQIPPMALRFALWVAYLDGTGNPLESLVLDQATTFPAFGRAPPADNNPDPEGNAYCWYRGVEPPPAPDYNPGRVAPPPVVAPGPTPTPTGITPAPAPGTATPAAATTTATWLRPVLVTAGAVVALGAVAWAARRYGVGGRGRRKPKK
jgi:hypothetical protein